MKKKSILLFMLILLLPSITMASDTWHNLEYDTPDQFHIEDSDNSRVVFRDDKNNNISLELYDRQAYNERTDDYNMLSYNTYQLNEKQVNETIFNREDNYIYTYLFELNQEKYIVYYYTSDDTIYVTNTFNPAHTLINSLKY